MKKVFSACLVALAATLGTAERAEAIAISLSPSPQTTTVGGTVSFDILADLQGAAGLGDFDFDITMTNPAIANFTGFTFSSLLGVVGTETISGQSGSANTTLDIFSVSLIGPAALVALQSGGPFSLGTLTFTAAAVGTTNIVIDTINWTMGDEFGNAFTSATFSPGVLTVTAGGPNPVSEAGTLLLVGIGLVGVFAARRRMRT